MKTLRTLSLTLLITLAFTALVSAQDAERGSSVSIPCGTIIDSEFTSSREEQSFSISLNAGDVLNLSAEAIGNQPAFTMLLTDPTNFGIAISGGYMDAGRTVFFDERLVSEARIDNVTIPASGDYTIRFVNFDFRNYNFSSDEYMIFSSDGTGGIGLYTLSVGCVLRDGTVINPGDPIPDPNAVEETITNNTTNDTTPVSTDSLPDFSAAQTAIIIPGTPAFGAVSPAGTEIFVYTIDAEGGSLLDLMFSKLSGNLNLSFVVLSSDNQILFQTNLVNLANLKVSLTIPTAGTYTIGVYRIDLSPPATPEATAFQIQATLNP